MGSNGYNFLSILSVFNDESLVFLIVVIKLDSEFEKAFLGVPMSLQL